MISEHSPVLLDAEPSQERFSRGDAKDCCPAKPLKRGSHQIAHP
jgi:hypothetical protein